MEIVCSKLRGRFLALALFLVVVGCLACSGKAIDTKIYVPNPGAESSLETLENSLRLTEAISPEIKVSVWIQVESGQPPLIIPRSPIGTASRAVNEILATLDGVRLPSDVDIQAFGDVLNGGGKILVIGPGGLASMDVSGLVRQAARSGAEIHFVTTETESTRTLANITNGSISSIDRPDGVVSALGQILGTTSSTSPLPAVKISTIEIAHDEVLVFAVPEGNSVDLLGNDGLRVDPERSVSVGNAVLEVYGLEGTYQVISDGAPGGSVTRIALSNDGSVPWAIIGMAVAGAAVLAGLVIILTPRIRRRSIRTVNRPSLRLKIEDGEGSRLFYGPCPEKMTIGNGSANGGMRQDDKVVHVDLGFGPPDWASVSANGVTGVRCNPSVPASLEGEPVLGPTIVRPMETISLQDQVFITVLPSRGAGKNSRN